MPNEFTRALSIYIYIPFHEWNKLTPSAKTCLQMESFECNWNCTLLEMISAAQVQSSLRRNEEYFQLTDISGRLSPIKMFFEVAFHRYRWLKVPFIFTQATLRLGGKCANCKVSSLLGIWRPDVDANIKPIALTFWWLDEIKNPELYTSTLHMKLKRKNIHWFFLFVCRFLGHIARLMSFGWFRLCSIRSACAKFSSKLCGHELVSSMTDDGPKLKFCVLNLLPNFFKHIQNGRQMACHMQPHSDCKSERIQ